ncbi:hypothetical protein KM043_018143 [Ampulex compressa]|nr:hypothetical protein KM043_018143 [Ampulex compressa]
MKMDKMDPNSWLKELQQEENIWVFKKLIGLISSKEEFFLDGESTRVYRVIVNKLSEDEWKKYFGYIMKYIFEEWGSGTNKNSGMVCALFKYWLDPIIKKHKDIVEYLWKLNWSVERRDKSLVDSYLQRMAKEMHVELPVAVEVVLTFSHESMIGRSNKNNHNCMSPSFYWDKTYTNKFINRKSLFELLRLVLDSAFDIKQVVVSIILDYFDKDTLTTLEKQVLYNIALENCNSPKFYKTESGATLISILAHWDVPKNVQKLEPHDDQSTNVVYSTYSEFFLNAASIQLQQIKVDILKAIVENKPFYGVLTAISKLVFQSGPESHIVTADFLRRLLSLIKDVTDFLLSVLSSKSESTEYSSSFAEMGLAISETIKSSELDDDNLDELHLTPAYQLLLSCIWISLKVSCEIASEIGALMHSDEMVTHSIDIISTVLLKCRHKGVVESAGLAMEKLMSHICKEDKYVALAEGYITTLLQDNANNALNITRRGAGLSIMFHRLIIGDKRKGRPLMHFAVQKLLSSLEDCPDIWNQKSGL